MSTPPCQPPAVDSKLVDLVVAARAGDRSAWTKLIGRFDTTLRSIARSCRLAPADVDDVVQSTWLALLQDFQRVREPAAIAGWLTTATRREAIRLQRCRGRELLIDDVERNGDPAVPGPEVSAIARERHAVLTRALATLPERNHRLMNLLLAEPALDYQQISARLAMPVGSIGPIRARSLVRLSRNPELCVHYKSRVRRGDSTQEELSWPKPPITRSSSREMSHSRTAATPIRTLTSSTAPSAPRG